MTRQVRIDWHLARRLGLQVRRLRLERGYTLARLADRCGSHLGTISRIEGGLLMPNTDLSLRLAESLGVSLDELCLGWTGWVPERIVRRPVGRPPKEKLSS